MGFESILTKLWAGSVFSKLSLLKYWIIDGSSELWQNLLVKTLVYKHFKHASNYLCSIQVLNVFTQVLSNSNTSWYLKKKIQQTINSELEKEEEWKDSLNVYFKPLNETNTKHSKENTNSEETLFGGVEYFGSLNFSISTHRVSRFMSQKAASLVCLQPFPVHRKICLGFLELSLCIEFLLKYLLLLTFSQR